MLGTIRLSLLSTTVVRERMRRRLRGRCSTRDWISHYRRSIHSLTLPSSFGMVSTLTLTNCVGRLFAIVQRKRVTKTLYTTLGRSRDAITWLNTRENSPLFLGRMSTCTFTSRLKMDIVVTTRNLRLTLVTLYGGRKVVRRSLRRRMRITLTRPLNRVLLGIRRRK